jgi:hypothetical protein
LWRRGGGGVPGRRVGGGGRTDAGGEGAEVVEQVEERGVAHDVGVFVAAPGGAAPGGAAAGLGATPELLAALTAVALYPRLAYVADAHGCPRMTSDVIESAIIVH